jgi:hypothetical protein
MAPIIVTVVSFYHFAVIRGEALTPSIAFTSVRSTATSIINFTQSRQRVGHWYEAICVFWELLLTVRTNAVFNELKFALAVIPETYINLLQV